MSALQLAQAAYSNPLAATKTDRALEFDVIAATTTKLRAVQAEDTSYPQIVSAVDTNRRMWSLIASSVSDSENTYPSDLKAGLFYLFEYTNHVSRRILSGEATVDSLIDINTSILRGLKGQVSQ